MGSPGRGVKSHSDHSHEKVPARGRQEPPATASGAERARRSKGGAKEPASASQQSQGDRRRKAGSRSRGSHETQGGVQARYQKIIGEARLGLAVANDSEETQVALHCACSLRYCWRSWFALFSSACFCPASMLAQRVLNLAATSGIEPWREGRVWSTNA